MTDVDLSFRPATYWTGAWDNSSRLQQISGVVRRHAAQRIYDDAGGLIPDDPMFAGQLSDQMREARGAIHPDFLGGEFLPPFEEGEVEIARLELASVTADVLSLRARLADGILSYRLVDEYWDEDSPSEFVVSPPQVEAPFTLGELVEVLLTIEEGNPGRRFALPLVVEDILLMNEDLPPESWHEFVRATSPFYPELERAFETRLREKAAIQIAEDELDDEPPSAQQQRRPNAARPPRYRE